MNCPECRAQVSETASQCPECKYPMHKQNSLQNSIEEYEKLTQLYVKVGIISAVLIVFTFILLSII